jgi:hypothetical protein
MQTIANSIQPVGCKNFSGFIVKIDTATGTELTRQRFKNEAGAHSDFDEITEKGNEHEGKFQWDLIVEHPELGELCRRTMFTNN